MSARLKPGPLSRQRHGVALAGLAAFAGALAVTFAATAGGGEPDAGGPAGSLAVPIKPAAYEANDPSLRTAETVPASDLSLGSAEPLPSLAARKDEPRPASVISPPAASTPTPTPRDSAPAPRAPAVPASPAPAPAPAPEPVSPPAPEPPPAPAPAPPVSAPEPPVDFDDSG